MNKPKRLLIAFNIGISVLLYSCNKSIKNDINVKVENISIVYSAPCTLRRYDTTIIFDSEFYIRGGFKIYNRSNNALVIHFNNLYSDIKTFDLSIYFNRLGILTEPVDVDNHNSRPERNRGNPTWLYYPGNRQYELSNHLGNVLATVSDKKFGIDV